MELVDSIGEAQITAQEFSGVGGYPDSVANRRFNRFFHWYYFPNIDVFGPSKFIGYKNTNLENYQCDETGVQNCYRTLDMERFRSLQHEDGGERNQTMKTHQKSIGIVAQSAFIGMVALFSLSSAPAFAAWPHVVFPSDQGITLSKGHTYIIEWGSVRTDPVNIALCEISPDGTFCFLSIASGVPNSESHSWTVPGNLPNASNYEICVGVIGVSLACSDYPFTIDASSPPPAPDPSPDPPPNPPPSPSPAASVDEVRTIARLYSAAFDREPKTGGLNFWVDSFESGKSITQIAKEFYQSPEFTARYGALSNQEYVEQLFRNVLGREGAQKGIDFWKDSIAGGTSRARVLEKFADSPENVSKTEILFGPMRLDGGIWIWKCGSDGDPGPQPGNALIGSWALSMVNGGPVSAGTVQELVFTGSTVTVTTDLDCEEENHYSLDGDIMTVTVTHQIGSQCGNSIGESFSAQYSVLNDQLEFAVMNPDSNRQADVFEYTRICD